MLYALLKSKMVLEDYNQKELAEKLNMNAPTLSSRLHGKYPFDIDTIYNICDILNIPYSDIPLYFPKGGKGITQAEKKQKIIRL